MPADYKEKAFETAIEEHLLAHGYAKGDNRDYDAASAPNGYDRARGLFPGVFVAFVKATQPQAWSALEKLHGAGTSDVLVDALCKAIAGSDRGSLEIIRHGFKCYGRQIDVAFFKPSSGLNPETLCLYAMNVLTVTRQVYYSGTCEKSIDVVLALNGVPIVTAELKNPMSGQTAEHAKTQYRLDRDERELLFAFKQRALVHFAVDPDVVWMTTRLRGKETFFLPFNKGNGTGAGNPENPAGHRTSYLWEQTWQRDSLLDIIARLLHLQVEERRFTSGTAGRKVRKETMIFPRYHQLDVVRRMEADARALGAGHNYLVQHSAGSGKSNSIGWLAHRLASLHDDADRRVFDSVIVVTDRVVLDQQLQDTIYQFEHKHGVVQKIDENSAQLAEAIRTGVPIIITTLQKFPFVTEKVAGLPDRRYAVIVDEAHSSQSGETATELKGVLAADHIRQEARKQAEAQGIKEGEEGADAEEEILRTMLKRGRQPNISFFAFTATPKYKTLEVFGRMGTDGRPAPFHLYSMRQAIEEGFILDVLRNYTTYKTYFGLIKSIEDDPNVSKRKAAKALARFMTLHPHNLEQKTEIMVEHFRASTRHKIGGKAKAMVVTASRMHAVRYKQAFDKYIKDNGYTDVKTLVAFSGTVVDDLDPNKHYTEGGMNAGIDGKELPEKFATEEFQILLVAEKYQTGFDQPLLHTMYVDKRLAGIQAVQTLSRLNRTHAGKDDTFVLDFYNERTEILEAFKPYYEQPIVGERSDPQQLYTLQARLAEFGVYRVEEVEQFCAVFFRGKANQSPADHAKMNAILDPAVERFKALRDDVRATMPEKEWVKAKEEAQEEFRGLLFAFRGLYAFLSQVIPFGDSDLEKLYTYTRFLAAKLPRRALGPQYNFDDEVALKYYRLQKISEGSIVLEPGAGGELKGPTAVGTGMSGDEEVELSQLIDILNERFGTDFKPADQLFLDSVREDAVANEALRQAASANSIENFKFVFGKALEGLFIDRMEQNEEIFARFMNEPNFQRLVEEHLRRQVYEQIRSEQAGGEQPVG
ncbi:MAG: type I restriction endonuclease subunit R [Phycisphaeraceae bacterium]|nr:type I restriction endonuclease subunit R [Phycisphaeraceae bacterium]